MLHLISNEKTSITFRKFWKVSERLAMSQVDKASPLYFGNIPSIHSR